MFIFYFLHFIKSLVLSIDLGSESMRSSKLVRGQPVSIVLNGEGRRYTPAVSSILPISSEAPAIFTDEDVKYFQRSSGNINLVQRFPLNSTRFLPQLLGKNYSNKLVSYFIKRNLTMPFDADEDKYLDLIAPPEFYAAQLLTSAINDCKRTKVNLTVDDLVLVVPKFLTHHQRKSFIRSAKLSTYKPYLIDSTHAVGVNFAVERSNLFKEKPLIVGFIDIGASQTQMTIQEFSLTKDGINILELGYGWTDAFGGYALDSAIGKEIKKQLLELQPDSIIDERSNQKIIAAGRKVKHELTLSPEVSLYLEDLIPGFDFTFKFSLEKLESIIQPELKLLKDTLLEAFHNAGFEEPEDLERIEIIGGATRSPVLINFINSTFQNRVPIFRTLNSEESNSIGGSYALAALKGGFLSTNIKFNGLELYKIDTLTGRFTSFLYSSNQKLPIGIKPFILTIDLGQKGTYDIFNGIIKVHACRKLTKSGLYHDKRFKVERILQAFEQSEKEKAEKDKIIHDFESFLIEARENLTKDPIVFEICNNEERGNALRIIAHNQYILQRDHITDEKELKRMKAEVEEYSKPIIKKLQDYKELPLLIKKLSEIIEQINRAVLTDWPNMGLKPKKKLLAPLGKLMSKSEKMIKQYNQNKNSITFDDISIIFEKLIRTFEKVKESIQSRNNDL